jgi:UDP-N-acetyl-D-galactosamine dehydrogenase
LKPLISASAAVGSILSPNNIVIFESTVFPGATEEVCVPILQSESGLTYNKDFYCGYSPERINPGDKINTITKITKITSGSNHETALEVDEFYRSFIKAGTYLAPSIKVAEAAKVIENSQRDLNIAFVNELSVMFDKIGLDTMEVLEAAGSKWNFLPFRPGMVGGHCIGVDPYYLTYKAQEVGTPAALLLAGRKVNDNMAFYAANSIIERMEKSGLDISNSRIGVLGITFKENCPDIRNSKIFDFIKQLQVRRASVSVCDPWADPTEVKKVHNINLINQDKIGSVDTLVVAVGHGIYRDLKIEQLRKICPSKNAILADLKSIYDKRKLIDSGFEVFRL